MVGFTEYTIGRQDADIVIDDPGVSKRHAELVRTGDGRFYLTDCASTSGTHVYRGGRWRTITQDFVEPQEKVAFGRRTFTPVELMGMLRSGEAGAVAGAGPPWMGSARGPDPKDKLPSGQVKRDPVTGDIVPVGENEE